MPGNRLSRDMYDNIPLPWDISKPVAAFSKHSFVRHDYDREGVLSNGVDFFGGNNEVNLDEIEKAFGTASMVTRWREAHPNFEGDDPVVETMKDLRKALGGKNTFMAGSGTAILLFKKQK